MESKFESWSRYAAGGLMIGAMAWSIYAIVARPPRWPASFFIAAEVVWGGSSRYSPKLVFFESVTFLLMLALPLGVCWLLAVVIATGEWREDFGRARRESQRPKRLLYGAAGAGLAIAGGVTLYSAMFDLSLMAPFAIVASEVLGLAPMAVLFGCCLLVGSLFFPDLY